MFEELMKKKLFIFIFIGIALFIYYAVTFNEVLLGDDILNSCVKGNVREKYGSIFSLTFNIVTQWIRMGRIYPIPFFETYYFFYFTGENILIYKVVAVIYNILSILLFSFCIGKFMSSSAFSCLLAILIGVLMPVFTFVPDNPFHAYMFMVPNVLFFASLSFLLLHRFFETNKKKFLCFSCFFSTLSLYCYEIAYIFPILQICLIILHSNGKSKIKNLILPFIITGIPFGFNCIWAFTHNSNTYAGSTIQLTNYFFKAFFYNFISVLPFSSWLVAKSPDYLFHNLITCYTNIKSSTILSCLLLVFGVYLLFKEKTKEELSNRKILICILSGLIIWFFPCFLLSLSSSWGEHTARTHFPWIPILMSSYGFAIVLNGCLFLLINHFKILKNFFLVCISIAIMTILPIYSYSYSLQYEALKDVFEVPRKLIVKAYKSGFFSQIPTGSLILLDTTKTICSPQIFSMLIKDIKSDYLWITSTETFFDKNKNISANAIYVAYVTYDKSHTLVLEKRNKDNPKLIECIISFPFLNL